MEKEKLAQAIDDVRNKYEDGVVTTAAISKNNLEKARMGANRAASTVYWRDLVKYGTLISSKHVAKRSKEMGGQAICAHYYIEIEVEELKEILDAANRRLHTMYEQTQLDLEKLEAKDGNVFPFQTAPVLI